MKMRRWVVETTGEDRPPEIGEYFLNEWKERMPETSLILRATFTMQADWPILKVIEICLDHSKALPCRYCEEIAEEYRQAMAAHRNMGD